MTGFLFVRRAPRTVPAPRADASRPMPLQSGAPIRETGNHVMKSFIASSLVALGAVGTHAAAADSASGTDAQTPSCAIAYVKGVGGSPRSLREYLASPTPYNYLKENEIQCKVSDDGRASNCTGVTYIRNEQVSVYDDSDPATLTVVAPVELEHGQKYPVILVVQRKDARCAR
jgi:hypothetical protein